MHLKPEMAFEILIKKKKKKKYQVGFSNVVQWAKKKKTFQDLMSLIITLILYD